MSDAISQHKRMAMGETVPLAKGKAVIQKYANGGSVMPEGRAANLPARGSAPPPFEKASGTKIATFKKGGAVPKKGMGLTIAIAMPVKKPSGRGR